MPKIEEKPLVSGKVVKTSAGRKKNSSRSEGDTSNPDQLKQPTKPEKVRNQLILIVESSVQMTVKSNLIAIATLEIVIDLIIILPQFFQPMKTKTDHTLYTH